MTADHLGQAIFYASKAVGSVEKRGLGILTSRSHSTLKLEKKEGRLILP